MVYAVSIRNLSKIFTGSSQQMKTCASSGRCTESKNRNLMKEYIFFCLRSSLKRKWMKELVLFQRHKAEAFDYKGFFTSPLFSFFLYIRDRAFKWDIYARSAAEICTLFHSLYLLRALSGQRTPGDGTEPRISGLPLPWFFSCLPCI